MAPVELYNTTSICVCGGRVMSMVQESHDPWLRQDKWAVKICVRTRRAEIINRESEVWGTVVMIFGQ